MAITRFTTPPIGLLVKGVDITDAETVYVTIEQGSNEINVPKTSLTMTSADSDTQITFSLTQQEAGSLNATAPSFVQVNWIKGGVRYATAIKKVKVFENLYDEVIS